MALGAHGHVVKYHLHDIRAVCEGQPTVALLRTRTSAPPFIVAGLIEPGRTAVCTLQSQPYRTRTHWRPLARTEIVKQDMCYGTV